MIKMAAISPYLIVRVRIRELSSRFLHPNQIDSLTLTLMLAASLRFFLYSSSGSDLPPPLCLEISSQSNVLGYVGIQSGVLSLFKVLLSFSYVLLMLCLQSSREKMQFRQNLFLVFIIADGKVDYRLILHCQVTTPNPFLLGSFFLVF